MFDLDSVLLTVVRQIHHDCRVLRPGAAARFAKTLSTPGAKRSKWLFLWILVDVFLLKIFLLQATQQKFEGPGTCETYFVIKSYCRIVSHYLKGCV